VDALFECVTDLDAPGASVLVAQSGQILHARGYGLANIELGVPNRTNTIFRLGSITKTFTAAAILQLHDRGVLDIDDPVARYLPDLPHAGEITIRHLLTHTSGITSLDDAPLEFAPGERMNYSSVGYRILGQIIEQVSGLSYEEYLSANIFQPLGLTSTGYERHATIVKHRASGYGIDETAAYINAPYQDVAATYSFGALYSTVEDLFRWDHALSSGGLLRPDTLALAFSPATLNDGTHSTFGLGCMIGRYRGLTEISHGGDITGFNSYIARFPEYDFTVIVLSNVAMRPPGSLPSARDLARRIAGIYLSDHMAELQEPVVASIDPAVYQAYVGRYRCYGAPEVLEVMGDILTISTDGSALFADTDAGRIPLLPESQTTFFTVPEIEIRLTFIVDETGRANRIIIDLMGVRELRGERVQDESQ
jgi:CubicO group peptidase (beta-lactamase class C family)